VSVADSDFGLLLQADRIDKNMMQKAMRKAAKRSLMVEGKFGKIQAKEFLH
jgi:hypothetical protein